MILRVLILFLLSGCAINRYSGRDLVPSESPCMDGTLVNIDANGCEMFYWGMLPQGIKVKVRCTYSTQDNFWTTAHFYAVPLNYDVISADWKLLCTDKYIKMFYVEQGMRLR